MAQVINVLLELKNPKEGLTTMYDINKQGLISLAFDRYSANQKRVGSTSILSELEMTFFDKTGHTLLTILQGSNNKIRFKYGFDDNLSNIYELQILKINTTYNDMGCLVSIGGIAKQQHIEFPAEVYQKGDSIRRIIEKLARRNNWYIGDNATRNEHIGISSSVLLPVPVVKQQGESDIDFIVNKLKPLADLSATNINDPLNTRVDFYDVQLTYRKSSFNDNQLELYFVKNLTRQVTKNVWKYSLGTSTNNKIISMTNRIDQSFLLGDIKLEIPITAEDKAEAYLIGQDEYTLKVKHIVDDRLDDLNKLLEEYKLPKLSSGALNWDIKFIESENTGNLSIGELIIKKFEEMISILNTIDLEVVGNPYIQHGDLIELEVMLDPTSKTFEQHPFFSGYWRVVTIREEIGQTGYTTKLNLVREIMKH